MSMYMYLSCVCVRDQAFSALPDTYQSLPSLQFSNLIQLQSFWTVDIFVHRSCTLETLHRPNLFLMYYPFGNYCSSQHSVLNTQCYSHDSFLPVKLHHILTNCLLKFWICLPLSQNSFNDQIIKQPYLHFFQTSSEMCPPE